jgi:hypothetical protein
MMISAGRAQAQPEVKRNSDRAKQVMLRKELGLDMLWRNLTRE